MVQSLRIQNYRGVDDLTLNDVSRINLIVGDNGVGKTSVLEALALWAGAPLHHVLRRGEFTLSGHPEVRHLFPGRTLGDKEIHVTACMPGGAARDVCLTTPWGPWGDTSPFQSKRMLRITDNSQPIAILTMEVDGGVNCGWRVSPVPCFYRDIEHLPGLIDNVGRDEEAGVVDALRIVDFNVSAFWGPSRHQDHGWLTVSGETVALDAMGDGMKRMLFVAGAMTLARGGVVLLDNIDMGLHHRVVPQMWQHVAAVAQRLNTTVFATTHSLDCVHALADIAGQDDAEVALYRIEQRSAERAVRYSPCEIRILQDHKIEAR